MQTFVERYTSYATNSTTMKMHKPNTLNNSKEGFKQASKAFNGYREGHSSHNTNKQCVGRLNSSNGFNKRALGAWE